MYSNFAIFSLVEIISKVPQTNEVRIEIRILELVHRYIQEKLRDSEQGKLQAHVDAMRSGDFESVNIKKLRGKIYELIFGNHRFTYFQSERKLYFVRGFRKRSNKTPRKEIEYAEKIYRTLDK